MARRFLFLIALVWLIGFAWFALALPRSHGRERTDAVVVLTGGEGRIGRGLKVLNLRWSRALLVSGVDREVKPKEFAAEYKVPASVMKCCVTLGFQAVDTRSNAREAALWIARRKYRTVRLVTSDWHMRRAEFEFERRLPSGVRVIRDAVPTHPSLRILFLEYNKLLARLLSSPWGV
jgi:uncharacterized SAM-binding protein YcdF (DUF218 family)